MVPIWPTRSLLQFPTNTMLATKNYLEANSDHAMQLMPEHVIAAATRRPANLLLLLDALENSPMLPVLSGETAGQYNVTRLRA